MAGLNDLFHSIISMTATLGGQAVSHGGKSCMLSVGRKIGWASNKSGARGRLQNHRIGAGYGKPQSDRYGNYDIGANYRSAALSGSGLGKKLAIDPSRPEKLFGRGSFNPESENKFSGRQLGSSKQQNTPVGLLKNTKFTR